MATNLLEKDDSSLHKSAVMHNESESYGRKSSHNLNYKEQPNESSDKSRTSHVIKSKDGLTLSCQQHNTNKRNADDSNNEILDLENKEGSRQSNDTQDDCKIGCDVNIKLAASENPKPKDPNPKTQEATKNANVNTSVITTFSPSNQRDTKGKVSNRTKTTMAPDAKTKLITWFKSLDEKHLPSKENLEELETLTGVAAKKIYYWFYNLQTKNDGNINGIEKYFSDSEHRMKVEKNAVVKIRNNEEIVKSHRIKCSDLASMKLSSGSRKDCSETSSKLQVTNQNITGVNENKSNRVKSIPRSIPSHQQKQMIMKTPQKGCDSIIAESAKAIQKESHNGDEEAGHRTHKKLDDKIGGQEKRKHGEDDLLKPSKIQRLDEDTKNKYTETVEHMTKIPDAQGAKSKSNIGKISRATVAINENPSGSDKVSAEKPKDASTGGRDSTSEVDGLWKQMLKQQWNCLVEIRKKMKEKETDLMKINKTLTEENATLTEKSRSLRKKNASLKGKCESIAKNEEDVKNDKHTLERMNRDLKEKIDEMKQVMSENNALKNNITALNEELVGLKETVSGEESLRKEIDTLVKEKAELKKRVDENEALTNELTALKKETEDLNAENVSLKKELEELREKSEKLKKQVASGKNVLQAAQDALLKLYAP